MTTSSDDWVWSDAPLSESDISGRGAFAKALAARINACRVGQASTVFGLVGPWGSGKTTLLAELERAFKEWRVVRFTPWAASDLDAMALEFVAALAEAFDQTPALSQKVAKLARFGSPILRLIPFAGVAAAELADLVLKEASTADSWDKSFQDINRAVAEAGIRVLVVVDDVDRLEAAQFRALLRLVRLLGRFTNIHYLLAYDEETVTDLLASADEAGRAALFMEKIVQHPFEIPPTPVVERRRWLRAMLAEFGREVTPDREAWADAAALEQVIDILAGAIETPRGIRRLAAQLRDLGSLVASAEIDALDFVVLTWLRLDQHELWEHIRSNPSHHAGRPSSESEEERSAYQRSLGASISGRRTGPVYEALDYLFAPEGVLGELLRRPLRARELRYFQRYFLLHLADDDVSERMVAEHMVVLLEDRPEIASDLTDVVLGADEERATLAIDIMREHRAASRASSRALIDFVARIDGEVQSHHHETPRHYAVDRWLKREVLLALDGGIIGIDELLDWLGPRRLAFVAFAAPRLLNDARRPRVLFASLAKRWRAHLASVAWADLVRDADLPVIINFLDWMADPPQRHTATEGDQGILGERIQSVDDLIDLAQAFVGSERWVGTGVTYDMAFQREPFRFAVGDRTLSAYLPQLPDVEPSLDFERSDRADDLITTAQARALATLELIGMARALRAAQELGASRDAIRPE